MRIQRFDFTRWARVSATLGLGVSVALTGCGNQEATVDTGSAFGTGQERAMSFEEYLAQVRQGDAYTIERDVVTDRIERVRESYLLKVGDQPGALTVDLEGGQRNIWPAGSRRALTYCIDDSFGEWYPFARKAFADASLAWEAAGDIDFVHLEQLDGPNCTDTLPDVMFNIRAFKESEKQFGLVGQAFFPDSSRKYRVVKMDPEYIRNYPDVSSTSFRAYATHELGHVLGLRHEHIRKELQEDPRFIENAWSSCKREAKLNSPFETVTGFDEDSIMIYGYCTIDEATPGALTALDKAGLQLLYGAPTANGSTNNRSTLTLLGEQSWESLQVQKQNVPLGTFPVTEGHFVDLNLHGPSWASLGARFSTTAASAPPDCDLHVSSILGEDRCLVRVPAGATSLTVELKGDSWDQPKVKVSLSRWQAAPILFPMPSDGGTPTDAGQPVDGGGGADAGTPLDAGSTFDAGTAVDGGFSADGGYGADAGTPPQAGIVQTAFSGSADAGVMTQVGRVDVRPGSYMEVRALVTAYGSLKVRYDADPEQWGFDPNCYPYYLDGELRCVVWIPDNVKKAHLAMVNNFRAVDYGITVRTVSLSAPANTELPFNRTNEESHAGVVPVGETLSQLGPFPTLPGEEIDVELVDPELELKVRFAEPVEAFRYDCGGISRRERKRCVLTTPKDIKWFYVAVGNYSKQQERPFTVKIRR